MNLRITLSDFDHSEDVAQIPVMEFDADGADYWILLPFFEKVEEHTSKLVDLGESVTFESYELPDIQRIIDDAIEAIPKIEDDKLIENDEEKLKNLLIKLGAMVELAIKHDVSIRAISASA